MYYFYRKQDSKTVASDFLSLAHKFDNCYLSEYAGLCFLGVAKCHEMTGDDTFPLVQGGRMFKKSDARRSKLGFGFTYNENKEGAYRCYTQALSLEKVPVLKACLIREFNDIHKNSNITSNFDSPSHRINDLEISSNDCIRSNDFISALEKLTEIVEDFTERKCNKLYSEVIARIEVTRLLLLLILELPANRQAPSQIKLLEKYSWNHENFETTFQPKILDDGLTILLESLVYFCQNHRKDLIVQGCANISSHHHLITAEQIILLNVISKKNI